MYAFLQFTKKMYAFVFKFIPSKQTVIRERDVGPHEDPVQKGLEILSRKLEPI